MVGRQGAVFSRRAQDGGGVDVGGGGGAPLATESAG